MMCNVLRQARNTDNTTEALKIDFTRHLGALQTLAQILAVGLVCMQILCAQVFGLDNTKQSNADFSKESAKLDPLKGKAHRLVVLDPASIEIIYLLGRGDSIKAIATMQQSHIYPHEQTSKLISVGTFSNPSVEKILSLKPTLVILSLYSLGLKERLENLGIQTAYLEAGRLDDMYENIAKIASLLDEEQKGQALIDKTKNELESIKASATLKGKSGVFLYSSNPLMGFNDNSVIADIMRLLGIENKTIASEVARPILSNEFLLKANPDMLILGAQVSDSATLIAQNPALKNLKAYKNGDIFAYPKAHRLLRVSPTIVEGIKDLQRVLEGKK